MIHIPHASTVIPAEYSSGLVVDLDELDKEIIWSTDAYCDELFNPGFGTMVIAQYSRLACDVERFRDDDQEPCVRVGQCLFYTHTARGKRFRRDNKALRDKALAEIYDPHHKELEMAVDNAISKSGHCLIIDGHSFCNDAFGYLDLPDFCIGSDSFHTDNELIRGVQEFLQGYGYSVAVNYPYAGAIVPLKYYHENPRVKSIMIEVN